MDLTWPLVFVILVGMGIWTKRQNTKHIRKMVKELKEKS
jgi:hypothetical protein